MSPNKYMVGTLVKMENRLPEYQTTCVRVSRNTFRKYSKRFKRVINSYHEHIVYVPYSSLSRILLKRVLNLAYNYTNSLD